MKRFGMILLILAVSLVFAAPALAAPGGMPAAHGLEGAEFGAAVSMLAMSEPGAVAAHVSGAMSAGKAGGMPALHGVCGRTFGGLVSELAGSAPGAVAEHVRSAR